MDMRWTVAQEDRPRSRSYLVLVIWGEEEKKKRRGEEKKREWNKKKSEEHELEKKRKRRERERKREEEEKKRLYRSRPSTSNVLCRQSYYSIPRKYRSTGLDLEQAAN